MRTLIVLLAGAALSGAALASRATPNGQIAGNGVIELLSLSPGPVSSTEPLYQFYKTTPSGADRLSDARLFLRLDHPTQTREYSVTSGQANGFASSTGFFGDLSGQNDTAGLNHSVTITTPSANHTLSIAERYFISHTPSGPRVEARSTLTNTGGSTLRLVAMYFFDIDPGGAGATQNFLQTSSNGAYFIEENSPALGEQMFIEPLKQRILDPIGHHAAGDGSVRAGLFDSSVSDYASRGDMNQGSGDFQVAYQWVFEIGAGQSVTVGADFGFGVPAPGGAALLGAMGAWGARRRRA